MSSLTLALGQASQRFTVTPGAAHADFQFLLRKGFDAWGFTEAVAFHDQLRAACHQLGYVLILPPQGDTAIAVRSDHSVLSRDYVRVNAGDHHRHGPRGIQVVTFMPDDSSEHITFCEAHWLTHRNDTGGQRLAMTQAMGDVVAAAGKGSRLAFWSGDTNTDDHPHDHDPVDVALRKADLTSCWDELGRYPDTHGTHTLDVVGSYDPDSRVTCTRARTWVQLHSDHKPLTAWYSIHHTR